MRKPIEIIPNFDTFREISISACERCRHAADALYWDQSYSGLGPWGSPAKNLVNDTLVFMPTRGRYGNILVLDPHVENMYEGFFQVSTATGTANEYQNRFLADAPGVTYAGSPGLGFGIEGFYAMNSIVSYLFDSDKINRMVLDWGDSVSDAIDMQAIDEAILDYTSWTQPVAPLFVAARKGIPSIYMIGAGGYGVRVAKITRKEDGGWQVGFISMG